MYLLVHDEPEHDLENPALSLLERQIHASKNNVSELLFHPANFMGESFEEISDETMKKEHFSEMMFNINTIYQRIHSKLNLWTRFKKIRMELHNNHDEENSEVMKKTMKEMMKKLEDLNCNNAANSEICHLVASFFEVLDHNEGDDFKLVYDDLPIYYVPEALKVHV